MSQQSDIDTIRRGYAAFAAGDMDTLRNDVFTPDALWVDPGQRVLTGTPWTTTSSGPDAAGLTARPVADSAHGP